MLRSIRQPLFAVAFVGSLFAFPALAQQSTSYPPACDASKVSKGDVDRAHTVFLSGKQFLDESNYDKAISYFIDAYSIDCSVHAILPIIATAHERKGDKSEAVHALEEYLRRVPNAPDHEHIERRIRNLNDQLAREQPSPSAAPPPATTVTVPAAAPPASAAPEPSATAAASAPAPNSPTSPTSTEAQPTGSRGPGPWVVVGVGGAAIVGGVVMYAVGSGNISSAEAACPGRTHCTESVASKGNGGRTLETVGAVVGAAGVVAVGAGLVWLFTDKPSSSPASGLLLSPAVGPGYAGLSLRSAF